MRPSSQSPEPGKLLRVHHIERAPLPLVQQELLQREGLHGRVVLAVLRSAEYSSCVISKSAARLQLGNGRPERKEEKGVPVSRCKGVRECLLARGRRMVRDGRERVAEEVSFEAVRLPALV
jgi:hypothetical protein